MKAISRFIRSYAWSLSFAAVILVLAILHPEVAVLFPAIGMALAKDRLRFAVKGFISIKVKELTSGGAATTMDFLGYTESTDFMIDHEMVEYRDEEGYLRHRLSSQETWRKTIQLLQLGIDEINLLKTANGKFFHVYGVARLVNGNYQEIYMPLCTISPKVDLKFLAGKRSMPVEITALMPKGAVTVTPADYNVAADTYGVIIENAAAKGEITTATGTIYTAAV